MTAALTVDTLRLCHACLREPVRAHPQGIAGLVRHLTDSGGGAMPPPPAGLALRPARAPASGGRAWQLSWVADADGNVEGGQGAGRSWWSALVQACASSGFQVDFDAESVGPPWPLSPPTAGADLCIALSSPMVLPCAPGLLDLSALYTLLGLRLRSLRHPVARQLLRQLRQEQMGLPKANPSSLLLTHLARHVPPAPVLLPDDPDEDSIVPPGGWGLGRHGHWQGALFVRHPQPVLLATLGQLQHLAGLALPRRAQHAQWATEGHYRLRWQTGPWLDHAILHRRRLLGQARLLCLAQDSPTLTDAHGHLLSPGQATQHLLAQAQSQHWAWEPNHMHLLPRPGKPPRPIEVLSPLHTLWQKHLLRVLTPPLDKLLSPLAHGFRQGRGVGSAVEAVRDALAKGYSHALRTDIARCFDSVPHAPLLEALDDVLPKADVCLRSALAACIRQPYVLANHLRNRHQGLAQGAPLSPLLLNLYLRPLDRVLERLPVFAVRYADDLLVLARSREQLQQALSSVRSAAERLGLALSNEKTQMAPVQQGFEFLGQHFDHRSVEAPLSGSMAQRKPLVISWPWLQLGVNGASLEARREGQILGRWPLRRLSAVVLLSPANLSTTLVERCHAQGVTVGMTLRSGRQHLVMPPMGRHHYDLAHQHAKWHADTTAEQALAIAQALVDAKLHNLGVLVAQRSPQAPLRRQLREVRQQLGTAADLATLRGHEGFAARLAFRWLNEQVHPSVRSHFAAERRARGAPDRLNSLLNLGYYFLAARLRVWVRMQSLNPYLAWLHDADDPYETLVYDLMEPFRPFVDRLVLRLINRQEIRHAHFSDTPGQHRLLPDAAARYAQAFEAALGESVGGHLLRDVLYLQARAVRSAVQQRGPLWIFRWQPRAAAARPGGTHADTPERLLWMAEEGDAGFGPEDAAPSPPLAPADAEH